MSYLLDGLREAQKNPPTVAVKLNHVGGRKVQRKAFLPLMIVMGDQLSQDTLCGRLKSNSGGAGRVHRSCMCSYLHIDNPFHHCKKVDATTLNIVPSLDSLLDKHDGPFGKTYTPKVGEEAITSEDLAERPSVIFVPFDLWAVVCKGVNLNRTTEDDKRQEETAEEVGTVEDVGEVEEEKPSMEETSVPEGEDEIGTDKANSPLDLARRLSEMMSILKGDDPEMFKVYRMVAQNLIDFLWAANNNLTTGIRIRSIEGDLEVMRHTRECIHDFLTFAEEGSLPGWNVQPETVPDQEHDEPQPPVFDQDQESVTLVEGQPQQPTVTMEDARNERPATLPPPPQGETTRPPGNPPAITAGQDDGPPVWVKSFMTGLAGTMADVGLAIREAVQVNRSSKE